MCYFTSYSANYSTVVLRPNYMTQTEALTILKTGKNVFITGPAGSGKTFVVNQYIRFLKDHEVPIGITASTGIAATHMGGVTREIH